MISHTNGFEQKGNIMGKKKGKFTKKTLVIILAIVLLFVAFFTFLNDFYLDVRWYSEVGYLSVFFKELTTKLKIGGPLFLLLAVVLSIYFKLLTLSGGKAVVVDKEKKSFLRDKLPYVLAVLVSIPTSLLMTKTLWYKFLEFTNSTPFGVVDPTFGKDISFYVFKLPFIRSLCWIVIGLSVLLFIITFIYSTLVIVQKSHDDKKAALNEALDIPIKGTFKRMWESYRVQLTVFAALMSFAAAALFYLKKFELVYSTNGYVYGASFTDIKVTMPVCVVMTVMCILLGIVILVFGLAGKLKPVMLIAVATVIVYFVGLGIGFLVEQFVVSPNEYSKESQYISYNIEYTQKAYGLDDIQTKTFDVRNTIDTEDIDNNYTTINNIPINDYYPTLSTYNSLQGIRTYYQFNDVDIDRYYLDGQYTEVFISAREMNTNNLNIDAQTWINMHLKYTHGFGVTVSPVNTITETGQPELIAKDIPTATAYGALDIEQERIYFGELTDDYAVVNTKALEFDYPSGSNNVENAYDGTAGIPLNLFNRISFAIKYHTMKFLLSSDITSESVMLINRNVLDRAMMIAPFLSYDSDPYLVISEGRLYWIIDALTTTDLYPFSQPYNNSTSGQTFNYIRNSVKVIVDAYNGDIKFYLVDEDDPIAVTYSKIYKDLFTSISEMPDDLRSHLRYSEAYFNVQSEMYLRYHMTNPSVFYNAEDLWAIATQFYQESKAASRVNASYMVMKLPDREEEFLLMVPFTVVNKTNMVAWMAGICDGEDYGKLIVYEFPKQSIVYGPMQIEQRIDQDTVIAPQLALLAQQGSDVLRGNLLTIPVEDSILYIEPVYVRASATNTTSLPEMKKVILSYKDQIIMADTLDDALMEMFGTNTEQKSDEEDTDYEISDDAAELIIQAKELYELAQKALSQADWAGYGQYMEQLGNVLEKLAQLQNSAEAQNLITD